MFVVPALTVVAKPVAAFTVATAVFVLLQLPPAVLVLVYVAVAPIQSGDTPLIVPVLTFGLTDKVLNADRFPQPINV